MYTQFHSQLPLVSLIPTKRAKKQLFNDLSIHSFIHSLKHLSTYNPLAESLSNYEVQCVIKQVNDLFFQPKLYVQRSLPDALKGIKVKNKWDVASRMLTPTKRRKLETTV